MLFNTLEFATQSIKHGRQNYGVNNAQTQNKIVDVLSLTNGLLPRAYNTDAKTNEVTSHHEGKTRRKETSLRNQIRYKLPPSIILLGVFVCPEKPVQRLTVKVAQLHSVPYKMRERGKERGL